MLIQEWWQLMSAGLELDTDLLQSTVASFRSHAASNISIVCLFQCVVADAVSLLNIHRSRPVPDEV